MLGWTCCDAGVVRLGILASEIEGESTGVGRFLEGLLGGLSASDFDGEIHLLFQGAPFDHALFLDNRFRPTFADRSGLSSVIWEQLVLPGELPELDLLVGPAYSLPPRLECPGVVMIHDLSFEVLPEEFRFRERWRRRILARHAASRARRVLVASREVAGQLEELYSLAPGKIGLVRYGVEVESLRNRAAIVDTPVEGRYLLFLGAVLPRRRLDLLLEAFARLREHEPDLRLVLAGPNRLPQPHLLGQWIGEHGLEEAVVELGWVPENTLPALLAGADLSVYLSIYEGFGLPPLESLAVGTVPVVSGGQALDDLWPEYPYRCLSLDVAEIERVLRRALSEREGRSEICRQGGELVSTLTWESCAQSFLDQVSRSRAQ